MLEWKGAQDGEKESSIAGDLWRNKIAVGSIHESTLATGAPAAKAENNYLYIKANLDANVDLNVFSDGPRTTIILSILSVSPYDYWTYWAFSEWRQITSRNLLCGTKLPIPVYISR